MSSNEKPQQDITKLPFTDLYFTIDGTHIPARFRPDPTKTDYSGNFTVPQIYSRDVAEIKQLIMGMPNSDGTVQYKGLRLRYSNFEAGEGSIWSAVRAVPLDLPDIDKLNINTDFVNILKGWGRRKGLIIVGGKTGEGKTTTCVALIKEYLTLYGGLAITCEDPIEYQLQGALSEKGYCLQTSINNEEEWYHSIRGIMRRRPEYIFIGEVRSTEAAEQLLKAVTSGHLVITTIHAASTTDTIQALLHLAENKLGPIARNIIADRLVGIVHQTLTKKGPVIKSVSTKVVSKFEQCPVATVIRSHDISNLDKNEEIFEPAK